MARGAEAARAGAGGAGPIDPEADFVARSQAAASVGQGLLVHRYTEAFARHDLTVGQVLLTADDLVRRYGVDAPTLRIDGMTIAGR